MDQCASEGVPSMVGVSFTGTLGTGTTLVAPTIPHPIPSTTSHPVCCSRPLWQINLVCAVLSTSELLCVANGQSVRGGRRVGHRERASRETLAGACTADIPAGRSEERRVG